LIRQSLRPQPIPPLPRPQQPACLDPRAAAQSSFAVHTPLRCSHSAKSLVIMARWMAWLGAIGTSAGVACGGDTAGPEAGITVSLSVQPAFAEPGDTVRVTVTAVPTAGVAVAVMRVAASGLVSTCDAVRLAGRYTAVDNVGLAWTVVRLTGAFTATDSVAHAFAKSVTRSVQFRVPAATPLGSRVNVRVIAADPAVQLDSASPPPVLVTDLA